MTTSTRTEVVDGPAAGADRVASLVEVMTLDEKLAQLVGLWMGVESGGGDAVAPLQDAMQPDLGPFEEVARHGLGQLTRPFGTAPVEPAEGAARVARYQDWLATRTRLGIQALVHEECLTGLAAWRATTYPVPLAWGASFDPELVAEMGTQIGDGMRRLGVHQGLAPVLDVVSDARWGRVEECISEDPYLVGLVATAYVRGLQSTGVVATLKHFVGYSTSRAGRNLAPVHVGRRALADVLLPPFEMAVLDGGADSVMNSYAEIDGVPVAADPELLTTLLRETWGFEGTVVADYFAVAFLETLHGVAGDLGEAAAKALAAGIDVELPTGNAYLRPLRDAVSRGDVPESLVDRALERVLRQKDRLGLLDPPAEVRPEAVDLDPPEARATARRLAEESVVLLQNDGALPLAPAARVAVLGPNAATTDALFGCYAFARHVLPQHPGVELGISAPTVLEALQAEEGVVVTGHAPGCGVDDEDTTGFAAAAELAAGADVAVVVVGDRAGLFGRGTTGEGCDADSLELPGVQRQLVEAVLATGTPVVLVLMTGRPYALGWAVGRVGALVQAFFPGQDGAAAVAGVLTGRVNPSGRLPVSMTAGVGTQPYSYLHPRLAGPTGVSNLDPTPVFAFGHGLSYTAFDHADLTVEPTAPTAGTITASVRVSNVGDRDGTEVVQLYGSDLVASVTRPVRQLLGFARVPLRAGEGVTVRFAVPTQRLGFTDLSGRRVVEPGTVRLTVGRSAEDTLLTADVELVGPVHPLTRDDPRVTTWTEVR